MRSHSAKEWEGHKLKYFQEKRLFPYTFEQILQLHRQSV